MHAHMLLMRLRLSFGPDCVAAAGTNDVWMCERPEAVVQQVGAHVGLDVLPPCPTPMHLICTQRCRSSEVGSLQPHMRHAARLHANDYAAKQRRHGHLQPSAMQIQQLVGYLQAHHPAAHVVLLGLFYMDERVRVKLSGVCGIAQTC